MTTISVDDYVQAHDVLDAMSHCLIDWHLWACDKAPAASAPLLKAASCVYDAAEALSACAVGVRPVVVPVDHEEEL